MCVRDRDTQIERERDREIQRDRETERERNRELLPCAEVGERGEMSVYCVREWV